MRVLFAMPYPGYLRYFDSVVTLLCQRGHEVHRWFGSKKQQEGLEAAAVGVSASRLPQRNDLFGPAARNVRWTVDFVRYLHPRFAASRYLRVRAARKLRGPLRVLGLIPRMPAWLSVRSVRALLALERALPRCSTFDDIVDEVRPDLVVVSPLVGPTPRLADLLTSARAAAVPTVVAVASWDNLTTKGMLRIVPDTILVWNEAQVEEAVELHGMPRDRLVVTGAQPFDRWFRRSPSRGAAAFRERVGLPPDLPFVLFVGSTASISDPEAEREFVRDWIAELRAADDAAVRDVAVLVRPHPYNSAHWDDGDLEDFDRVSLWPRSGANPVNEDDRNDFFDSLYHAAAVVGVNTSAMIEAAVVGKPVLAIASPRFDDTQRGTIHFRHLLPEHGGFLQVAESFDEHLRQLAATLREPTEATERLQSFVSSFVRPRGVERECTPIVVQELERVHARGPLPDAAPAQSAFTRFVLRLVLLLVFTPPGLVSELALPWRRLRRRLGAKLIRARALSRFARSSAGAGLGRGK
jgi:hypothetical protein